MTPDEINCEIAKWMDYYLIQPPEEDGTQAFALRGPEVMRYGWHATDNEAWADAPDYYRDLNAIHEAESHGGNTVIKAIRGYLWELCDEMTAHHATAPQRCEALLRTIGKWKE